jgi:FixJ family two-component response regulator
MERSDFEPDQDASSAPGEVGGRDAQRSGAGPTVLVVAGSSQRRHWMLKLFSQQAFVCCAAESASGALSLLKRDQLSMGDKPYDAAVIDLANCTPANLKLIRELDARGVICVVLCPPSGLDAALSVMKAGASDVLNAETTAGELARRVRQAMGLNVVREEPAMTKTKATNMRPLNPELAGQAGAVFGQQIAGELDVESLLRSALEYLLGRMGSFNGAIFLPGSSGEYALGAYVNLSCPRETVEVLLDQLANIAAPKLEKCIGVKLLMNDQQLADAVGEGAEWLGGHQAMTVACHVEGECLAVFVLFRQATANGAWNVEHQATLASVSEAFGKQLAKVIRIHHRHLPRENWGAPGDGWDAADDDMAA